MSPKLTSYSSPTRCDRDNSGTIASTAPDRTTASTMSPSVFTVCPSFASSANVRTAVFNASRARSASGRATSFSVVASISFTKRSCSPSVRSAAAAARCTFVSRRSSSARNVGTPSSSRTIRLCASESCTSLLSASAARRASSCDAAACDSAARLLSALNPATAGGGGRLRILISAGIAPASTTDSWFSSRSAMCAQIWLSTWHTSFSTTMAPVKYGFCSSNHARFFFSFSPRSGTRSIPIPALVSILALSLSCFEISANIRTSRFKLFIAFSTSALGVLSFPLALINARSFVIFSKKIS